MLKRFFLQIAYLGTNYHGWQRQPNALTVQEAVEERLTNLLGEPISSMGCGRTDTGVHASKFMLHFDTNRDLPPEFLYRLEKALPRDIAAHWIFEVDKDAHARFDATRRSYDYFLHFHKDPFVQGRSTYVSFQNLDFEKMDAMLDLLKSQDDFYCFCKFGGANETTLCQIFEMALHWNEETGSLRFHISANRFLRGMIRLIVGTMILVGRGKMDLEEVASALTEQRRLERSYSAPADGLYLTEVLYPFIENKHRGYIYAPMV